jgi:hypothetical protein
LPGLPSLKKGGWSQTKVRFILSGPMTKEHILLLKGTSLSDPVNVRQAVSVFVFPTNHLQPYSICDKELDKLDWQSR